MRCGGPDEASAYMETKKETLRFSLRLPHRADRLVRLVKDHNEDLWVNLRGDDEDIRKIVTVAKSPSGGEE